MNLHYGCGLAFGKSWYNCDCSPTLWLQRVPVFGGMLRLLIRPRFPTEVHFGNIVYGIALAPESCDAIFCSHVLEHLALDDLRVALQNTHRYLKPGGIFRLVVPDFEQQVTSYLSNDDPTANSDFMTYSGLGRECRPRGLIGWLREYCGNSRHLWMWDYKGLANELVRAGFSGIRRYSYGEAVQLLIFQEVENEERFRSALAIECTKV